MVILGHPGLEKKITGGNTSENFGLWITKFWGYCFTLVLFVFISTFFYWPLFFQPYWLQRSVCSSYSNYYFTKGGWISESFSVWLKSKKKVPNHSPEHYPPKEKMLRRVIWHLFLEIWGKVKNILRLSHLYIGTNVNN